MGMGKMRLIAAMLGVGLAHRARGYRCFRKSAEPRAID